MTKYHVSYQSKAVTVLDLSGSEQCTIYITFAKGGNSSFNLKEGYELKKNGPRGEGLGPGCIGVHLSVNQLATHAKKETFSHFGEWLCHLVTSGNPLLGAKGASELHMSPQAPLQCPHSSRISQR